MQWVHIYTFAIHVFGLSFAVSSVENVFGLSGQVLFGKLFSVLSTHTHTEFLNEHLCIKSHVEVLLGQSIGGAAKAGRICTFFSLVIFHQGD